MKWEKDESTFCRSYVFMEKFKLAQNKKFTGAATDIWTLRDTAKLLNISSITDTFQVFCLQFKKSQKQLLLACYTSTSKLLSTQFWHNTPQHSVHIEVHFNPYVIQVHQVVHLILQPHLIIYRSSCGAQGFVICAGRHIPLDIFHPHCSGGKLFLH